MTGDWPVGQLAERTHQDRRTVVSLSSTAQWPVGQIAEIEAADRYGPYKGLAARRVDGWAPLGESRAGLYYDREVTAVRPLRLVPQDAVVLYPQGMDAAAIRGDAAELLRMRWGGTPAVQALDAVADAIEAAETASGPLSGPGTPAGPVWSLHGGAGGRESASAAPLTRAGLAGVLREVARGPQGGVPQLAEWFTRLADRLDGGA